MSRFFVLTDGRLIGARAGFITRLACQPAGARPCLELSFGVDGPVVSPSHAFMPGMPSSIASVMTRWQSWPEISPTGLSAERSAKPPFTSVGSRPSLG